jgi:hypothetical protein
MFKILKLNKMKTNYILYLIISLLLATLMSCEPRIKLELDQWGDHAFLTNAQVFTLQADQQQLQEYFESGTLTPALRRVISSTGMAVIDSASFTATVKVPVSLDLTRTGFIFYHQAVRIEPTDNSPIAGIIADLSKKEFHYRLTSADGSFHDWTILIVN